MNPQNVPRFLLLPLPNRKRTPHRAFLVHRLFLTEEAQPAIWHFSPTAAVQGMAKLYTARTNNWAKLGRTTGPKCLLYTVGIFPTYNWHMKCQPAILHPHEPSSYFTSASPICVPLLRESLTGLCLLQQS